MPSGYWSFRNPSGWSQSGCVPIYWILWDVYIQPVGDRTFSAMAWETFWVQTASWCVQISPWHGNGRWRTVTETRSARLRTEALGDRRTQGGRVQCQVGILFSITTVHKQLSQTLFAIPWSTEAVVQNPAGADSGSRYPGLTVNGGRLTQFLLIISKGIFSQWKGCFLKFWSCPGPHPLPANSSTYSPCCLYYWKEWKLRLWTWLWVQCGFRLVQLFLIIPETALAPAAEVPPPNWSLLPLLWISAWCASSWVYNHSSHFFFFFFSVSIHGNRRGDYHVLDSIERHTIPDTMETFQIRGEGQILCKALYCACLR